MKRKLETKDYAYVEVEVVLAPPNKMAILVRFGDIRRGFAVNGTLTKTYRRNAT